MTFKTGERYNFNIQQWHGICGTGGWVRDVDRFEHVAFTVPIYAESRIRVRRLRGFFYGPGGVHDTMADQLQIVEAGQ